MARKHELTERDLKILNDLYNMGVMKMKQILELYFPNTKAYGYKRINKLKKRGLIKRVGQLYLITDKGMNTINLRITVPSRKLINKVNKEYRLKLSEVYTKLHPYGWKWMSSRFVKAQYNLDRGYCLNGQLENILTGDKYIVYLLSQKPRSTTIGRIKSEIEGKLRVLELNRVIMLCESIAGYEHFVTDNETYKARNFHILPFGLALNKILRCTSRPDWLKKLADQLLHIDKAVTTEKPHADLEAVVNGKEYYLTELITYDIVKRYHLLRYGYDQGMSQPS